MKSIYEKTKAEDPIMAILREAYERVPRLEDRTAYCLKRQREFQRNEHVNKQPAEVVPFPRLVDTDPIMARLCGDGDR